MATILRNYFDIKDNSRIVDRLLSLDLDAELLVPEERDISLPSPPASTKPPRQPSPASASAPTTPTATRTWRQIFTSYAIPRPPLS